MRKFESDAKDKVILIKGGDFKYSKKAWFACERKSFQLAHVQNSGRGRLSHTKFTRKINDNAD